MTSSATALATLLSLAKFGSFLLFLLLGVRVARSRGAKRKRAISLFVVYFVLINGLAGASQFDNWPFTSNTLAVGSGTDDMQSFYCVFYGVDRFGREWAIDPMTWSPVFDTILQYWITSRYPTLSAEEKRDVATFLLRKANSARARLRLGRAIGFERRLGAFSCPYWWVLNRHPDAPAEPYRMLRLYRFDFTPRRVLHDPGSVKRVLLETF